jgi:hypothetical protein
VACHRLDLAKCAGRLPLGHGALLSPGLLAAVGIGKGWPRGRFDHSEWSRCGGHWARCARGGRGYCLGVFTATRPPAALPWQGPAQAWSVGPVGPAALLLAACTHCPLLCPPPPLLPKRWQQIFVAAKTSLVDRDDKVAAANELIEKKLRLLGCTAIEDKLQVCAGRGACCGRAGGPGAGVGCAASCSCLLLWGWSPTVRGATSTS